MITAGDRHLQGQQGAALVAVLVMVVIVGLVVGIAGTSWRSITQRAREAELFWRGDQYRQAIQSYYEYGAGGSRNRTGQYPAKLEDLIKDPRSLSPKKHIRRLYSDPMTGDAWELVKDKGGRITGVQSRSDLVPFRQDGFPTEYEDFAGAQAYSAWKFEYQPDNKSTTTTVPTQGKATGGEEP